MNKEQAGFSFVEIIVVAGVVALVGAVLVSSLLTSRRVHNLAVGTQDVVSLLRLAQSKTLAGEDTSVWGIHLEASQVTLFRGNSFASATFTEVHPISDTLQIANISLQGGGVDVIFKSLSGATDQYGSFALQAKGTQNFSNSIAVESDGKTYVSQGPLSPAQGRTMDTRHRSYELGWSMTGAATMVLTFSDPPGADTATTVPMAPYFNAGPTKFDWSGTVAVGGINQVLRIHTTLLNAASTTLSIDRDCRTNTKKVAIAVDGKQIATYEADCRTLTVGAFGGVMSEP